ncbi:MAG: hypothetical protein Q9201_003947 [Fulgogasparrea decipioides]
MVPNIQLPVSLLLLVIVLLFSALSTNAQSPGDPGNPLDYHPTSSTRTFYGISDDLLSTFKVISQYAAASYCPSNNKSPSTRLTCPPGNCPLVEASTAVTLSEFEDTPRFDDTGYIALDATHKLIVLSIRGSVSKQNWHADWDMIRTDTNFCHECRVHRGFLHSWEEMKIAVLTNMKKAVEIHPDYRIVVTGHSLGGAVATLAAAELRRLDDHFRSQTELYTFGSPRLANKEAAAWFSGQSRLSWRITYKNDLVPRLPPRALGYHHTVPEYWIPRDGDDPKAREVEWAAREDSSWGNEGELIPSRSAHGHYFGDIGKCSDGLDERVAGGAVAGGE